MFNAKKFLRDHNIYTDNTGKNASPGWTQINCPLCTDNLDHGGFNLKTGIYNCWKCGTHTTVEIIQALLKVSKQEAYTIAKHYYSDKFLRRIEKKQITQRAKEVILPGNKLNEHHKNYLRSRNFNPHKLEKLYNLKGTDHTGDYSFRIICPIYLNNELVSFQGRDYTEKSKLRYKACQKVREVVEHKHTLYNIDNAVTETVIVTEGVTDVWRLGSNTTATFGTAFTQEQAALLLKFKRIFILYDPEDEAQEQADKLCKLLARNTKTIENIILNGSDPGDLTDEEANYIKKQLMK